MRDKEKPITEKSSIFEQMEEDKDKARQLLREVKGRTRSTVKVEHFANGRVLTYETTPERLESLLKRLSKTGKTKIL